MISGSKVAAQAIELWSKRISRPSIITLSSSPLQIFSSSNVFDCCPDTALPYTFAVSVRNASGRNI